MQQSLTALFRWFLPLTILTDYIRRYFTESSEIFTVHATITDELAVSDLPVDIQSE
jgi:hypothetical protein